jgi:hypothetical protein
MARKEHFAAIGNPTDRRGSVRGAAGNCYLAVVAIAASVC